MKKIDQILANTEKIVTGLDDLNQAIANLQAEELQIVADFQTLLTQNAGDSDAAVEAVSQQVAAVTAALQAGDPVPTLTGSGGSGTTPPATPPTPAPPTS
jgi:fructose-bisphosphate aldolase class 1